MSNDPYQVADPALQPVAAKVREGVPLTVPDGQLLARSRDLHGIGRLADAVRRRIHGDAVYYNRNRHINYTNVCALSCKFCSFYRKRGEAGAYEMSVEQVVDVAVNAWEGGATEVHIVGGLHPWKKFDYYLEFLRGIRAAAPGLHIKAFTAIEIVHFSRIARMSIEQVLAELKAAGLGSLPGGGAEIFDDRVHDEAFKGKVREDKWFAVHRAAHDLGLFSNATMLYGHIEGSDERVRHLIKLRDHQSESLRRAGLDPDVPPSPEALATHHSTLDTSDSAFFNCVIPLSFIPEHSELGHLPGPTGLMDLKTLAIARLLCNNIANIKAFWIMQGTGLSQISLDYGVNDLDGTVVWYDITKRQGGGGTTKQELHVDTLQRLIRDAGYRAVERDTVYREIHRDADGNRLESPELSMVADGAPALVGAR
jgi:aminodeoxyfutalosine synthase